jgi:DNA polymerase-3 subunit beta
VATDGHRLAVCTFPGHLDLEDTQVIIPRKGVLELSRLMQDDDGVTIILGSNHVRATTDDFTFTSKLVDGKFPDYERVLPRNPGQDCEARAWSCARPSRAPPSCPTRSTGAYASNCHRTTWRLRPITRNRSRLRSSLPVSYSGDPLEIGFNVGYLLDVLGVLSWGAGQAFPSDPNSSALLEEGRRRRLSLRCDADAALGPRFPCYTP